MSVQPPKFRPPFYKRQFVVNWKFQVGFTIFFLMFFILAQGILYFVLADLLNQFSAQFEALKSPGASIFAQTMRDSRQLWDEAFVLISECTFLVTLTFGILFSHRVAGPMFRLRSHFNEGARTGSLADVKFRAGDFFQDVPVAFNHYMATLRHYRTKGILPDDVTGAGQPPKR